MKKSNPYRTRLIVLLGFLAVVLIFFAVMLFHYQIIKGNSYRAQSMAGTARRETVETSRGIITDRNGKVLVSNRLTYTLRFSDESFDDDAACNAAVWRLITLCRQESLSWIDPLPLTNTAPFALTTDTPGETFVNWLDQHDISYTGKDTVTLSISGGELLDMARKIYKISDDYTDDQARLVAGVRYGAEVSGGYVFAEDVPVEVISQVVDGHFAGVSTGTSSQRVYNTTYAAHILGRVSRIFAEDWNDKYKDNNDYSMDDLVGKGGVEEAFEQYLHGVNGVKLVTTDKSGKVTGELYAKEPQPGNTVALTIDLDLQKTAEDSLAATIQSMTKSDGVARGGAAAVIGVGTGEVLALASYPTYDLSQWDEMYDTWSKDAALPMFNRATDGTYAPGSTFKLCTSVAALESGVITPSTTIVDRGIYTYYEFPQPRCWIYNATGGTHGAVNVSQAITVSCNYFFYEVGRLTGIQRLDDYASQFGLGRSTGIEIGDSDGVLASPEYAEKIGETWTDGQTITAAIGQSYNLFTPLQLANYVATLVSGGDHYEAHLLKSAKSYDNSSVVYAYNKGPTNHVDMSDSTLEAVKAGARGLATGSLSYVFNSCIVPVGCKTGTAETGGELSNGCFVAFAPYDDPQIAVCVVIEQGGGGANLAPIARDIINSYFSSASTSATVVGENTLLP